MTHFIMAFNHFAGNLSFLGKMKFNCLIINVLSWNY